MKAKLAVAFAVLLFASLAHADGINVDGAVIPDGSTVTSIQEVAFDGGYPATLVSFSFADGTGWTENALILAGFGELDFTTPVSDLSFVWDGATFAVSDNLGDSYVQPSTDDQDTGVVTFGGPGVSSVQWSVLSDFGTAGIESMTYTVDATDPPTVPEPSSLLLSGMGLAALIGLARRIHL